MANPLVGQLLASIDQAYNRKSWHGTNLRGSIGRVTAAEAAWRPAPGRHSICEIVVHAAYWKYACWRRLSNGGRGSFDLKGSNWFTRPEDIDEQTWRADVALLDRWHRTLRTAVAQLNDKELGRMPRGSKLSNISLLTGVAAHDLYHAGQIQLLKKFYQDR